jgi:hypothetical protein
MFVEIVNLTDGPGRKPTQVDIYNRVLRPGDSIKIPAELIDRRLRALADAGHISIGPVPSWYAAAKVHKSRVLSPDEVRRRISPVKQEKTPEKEEATPLRKSPPKKEAAPLELVDSVTTEDRVKLEKRR